MPAIIALTTDFGTADSYVAQMKGVILGIATGARLVDVTHAIPPQDVPFAAIVLAECVAAFPPGTVHLAVVDPGVGTQRRLIAAEIGDWRFVAPDNGLLSAVARVHGLRRAFELTERRWWRYNLSATFHGRDIMAPVAAHWAHGVDPGEFGPAIDGGIQQLALGEPRRSDRMIAGTVIRCDAFGNAITNIPGAWVGPDAPAAAGGSCGSSAGIAIATGWRVSIGGRNIGPLRRTYGDVPPREPLALVGSHGFVEIAVNCGSAQAALGARVGSEVRLERAAADSPGGNA